MFVSGVSMHFLNPNGCVRDTHFLYFPIKVVYFLWRFLSSVLCISKTCIYKIKRFALLFDNHRYVCFINRTYVLPNATWCTFRREPILSKFIHCTCRSSSVYFQDGSCVLCRITICIFYF